MEHSYVAQLGEYPGHDGRKPWGKTRRDTEHIVCTSGMHYQRVNAVDAFVPIFSYHKQLYTAIETNLNAFASQINICLGGN